MSRAGKHNRDAAEAAVLHVVRSKGVTYRQAADQYKVPIDALRSRINNRWGSLEAARLAGGVKPNTARLKNRVCMRCRDKEAQPGLRMCQGCKAEIGQYHNGIV